MEARIVPAVTAEEQLFLELLNRARANPSGEAARYGIDLNEGLAAGTISNAAKQPLAPNTILHDVMDGHLRYLIDNDLFTHDGPGNQPFYTRISNAGYSYTSIRENLVFSVSFAVPYDLTAAAIEDLHRILFVDSGVDGRGHRVNMMANDVNEAGAALELGTDYVYRGTTYPSVAMGGHDLGNRGGNSFITGVAFTDSTTADNFYTIGEGLAGVTVTAVNGAGTRFTVTTNEAGGYALQVPSGSYTVSFSGGALAGTITKSVNIASENVKVDANRRVDQVVTPIVSLAASSYVVNENGGSLVVTVRLSQAASGATSVRYATNAGTATAGQDFTSVSGTLSFAAGETSKTFSVPILNNAGIEPNETFAIQLSAASGLTLGGSTATVTVIDDDEVSGPATDILAQNPQTGQWILLRSNGQSLVSTGFGATPTGLHNPVSGDFNGDGRLDVAGRNNSGRWLVGLNNGAGFTLADWGGWSTGLTYSQFLVADFTGDGRDDVAAFDAANRRWYVARSTGAAFTTSTWLTISGPGQWSDFVVGDFNADRRQDVMIRNLSDGQLYVLRSTGSSFAMSAWGQYQTQFTWSNVRSGDFNGDGRDDLMSYVASQSRIYVALSSGTGFVNRQWTQLQSGQNWADFRVLNFNGDARDDIFVRNLTNGDLFVSISNGAAGGAQRVGNWSTSFTFSDILVGDFNGDGRDEIASRVSSQGKWYVAVQTGGQFRTTQWGSWSTGVNWTGIVGEEVV